MKIALTLVLSIAVLFAVSSFTTKSSAKDNAKDVIVLSSANTIVLNTEVNGDSVAQAITDAKKLDRLWSKGDLYLFLNTPGGSIQAGLELIEVLHGLDHKVNTITLFAASMGWQIAQNLDQRLILKNGVLMSHHAAGEFQGSFGGVQPSQVDARYQLWLDRVRELDEQTVKRTNGKQTYDSYIKAYDHEMWLTGSKAIAGGYADRIVTVKCDDTLSGTSEHHVVYMGLPVTYDLDNCTVNTSPLNIRIGNSATPLTTEYAAHVKEQFLTQFTLAQTKPVAMY